MEWRSERTRRFLKYVLGTIAILLFLGLSAKAQGPNPQPKASESGPLTFNRDIAPIIYSQCVVCHQEGQAGPFPLVTYNDVAKRAPQIVKVTQRRYMPPWLPEAGFGDFQEERRLSDNEIERIKRWVDQGTPEGSPDDHKKPSLSTRGWLLGPPDLVVTMPAPYTLPADGRDIYRNFVVPVPLKENRFVRAIQFQADTSAIHHMFVRLDRTHESRRLDAEGQEPGFGGMAAPQSVEAPGGYFLSWQPGRGPTISLNQLAWELPANSDFVLQMHMQPQGKPEKIQSSVGIYFTDQAPTNAPFKFLLSSYAIDIPAGATDYEIKDKYVLPVDMDLLAVLPHAHYLGKEMESYAVLPGGRKEWLLKINHWDFKWQSAFTYKKPVSLPKGSEIFMRFTYDNSSNNVSNPKQPPQRVQYGLQSTDEMGELWFQALTRTPADLKAFELNYQKRLMKDSLEFSKMTLQKNPNDAHAHVQIGKVLYAMRRTPEAQAFFQRAVELDPQSAEAHYHVGVVAMGKEEFQTAIHEFRETLRINPEHIQALNNLGLILMSAHQMDEAEQLFKTALRINPEDKLVKDNMDLLLRMRKEAQAKQQP